MSFFMLTPLFGHYVDFDACFNAQSCDLLSLVPAHNHDIIADQSNTAAGPLLLSRANIAAIPNNQTPPLPTLIQSPAAVTAPILLALRSSTAQEIILNISHQFISAVRQIRERISALLLNVVEATGRAFVALTKSMII
ncbi:59533208-5f0c-49ab-a8ea-aa930ebdafb3 [Sclerotinia trifoliorum]|uniref:59533208-5f0c-49ab-a8ea-aa930ebdafb3 n=1 Tax=Sclerotinia trifoliorum TaxID=28548 RepID=A0A8H2ZTM4_9HELO|nr:59533208-5f0c-49ab-a8ea-aa930ebdafb3 [Sclerotinia trifoliorum]